MKLGLINTQVQTYVVNQILEFVTQVPVLFKYFTGVRCSMDIKCTSKILGWNPSGNWLILFFIQDKNLVPEYFKPYFILFYTFPGL